MRPALLALALSLLAAGAAGAKDAKEGAAPKPASAETKAYCKKMYGKAYMLCGTSDRTCKFLAASHWEECEKTGRWRG